MKTSINNEQIFSRCNISKWRAAGYSGKGVKVAILDDGSKPHPCFKGATYPLGCSKNGYDHATMVEAVIKEVAPDCEIMMFDGFNIKENIDWILQHKVDVVNISYSGVPGELERLKETEIPIFCASGNDGYADKISNPARLTWTYAVGAWSEAQDRKSNYSNGGNELDFVGYNIEMLSTRGSYMTQIGTSFTTPFATGLCALFLQRCQELGVKPSRQQVKEYFIKNAIDTGSLGKDKDGGYGLIALSKEIRPNRVDVYVGTDRAAVNGEEKKLEIVVPTIKDRTVVPLRFMGESLGCVVEWEQANNKASLIQY